MSTLPILALSSASCIIHTHYDSAVPPPKPPGAWTRFVCISDTHARTFAVPDGDVLLHAGDLSNTGKLAELRTTMEWLRGLPHLTKIVIAGNHDLSLHHRDGWYASHWDEWHGAPEDTDTIRELMVGDEARAAGIIYLQDEMHTFKTHDGGRPWTVWGSPWTPEFCDWAFNYDRGTTAEQLVSIIPRTDILMTHGPPHGILDATTSGEHVGCEALRARLDAGALIPRLHVFGHIHEDHGALLRGDVASVNAACAPAGRRARRRSWERGAFGEGAFAPVLIDLLDAV